MHGSIPVGALAVRPSVQDSPRSHESSKAGQTLKQKRAEKRSAAEAEQNSSIPSTGKGS